MPFPWANIGLLILILAQLSSGFIGLISGSEDRRWVLWLHGIGAYAIILVLYWKAAVIFNSLSRRSGITPARVAFFTLAALLLATLGTGIFWTFAGRRLVFEYSLITIHVIFAFTITAFLSWHVFHTRFVFCISAATDRRAVLRMVGTALGGIAFWQIASAIMIGLDLPGARRRFTGSYETGSLSGEFPLVTWLFDYPAPIDVTRWQLRIDGAVERSLTFTYNQLQLMASDKMTEIIDCTGGWYSEQEWQGVNVERLLQSATVKSSAHSVSFVAISGYERRYSLEEVRGYILALQVAGQTLSHGHGFPIRLVAPGHRGFEWVKWIDHIRVHETTKYLQPPVPLR